MNTRIQELMKEATYIVKGANGCVWGNNVNLEKFAELIVLECSSICYKGLENGDEAAILLMNTFGVEE